MPEKRPLSDESFDSDYDSDEQQQERDPSNNVLAEFTQDPNQNKRRRLAEAVANTSVSSATSEPTVRESTAGVIETIRMTNFMCHSNFEVTLGPQTNFIIGKNGSGKSAVLTCLSICLGAKANETDRGTNLKAMIKNGKNTARLTVIFKNEGLEAYLPEVYGPRIVVQRSLKRDGISSYTIKSASNKTISTKKSELDAILSHFGITITNPMTILTQTEAKQFLASSTSEMKFRYFMAGTRLDIAVSDCAKTEQDLKEVREALSRSSIVLEESSDNFKKAREMYKRMQSTEEHRVKLKLLLGRAKWWRHLKIREQLDQKQENEVKLKELIQQASLKAAAAENEVRKLDDEKRKITERIEVVRAEYQEHQGNLETTKEKAKDTQKQVATLDGRIKATTEEIKKRNEDLQEVERKIQQEEQRLENSENNFSDNLVKRRSDIERQLADLDKEKNELLSRKRSQQESFKLRMDEVNELVKEKNMAVSNLRREINTARGQKRDKFAPYGRNIRALLNDVNGSRSFHNKPIGPIGLGVSMKAGNDQWTRVVDNVLSKQLSAFIVQDFHDQKVLSGLFRKHRHNADIIVRKMEVFQYDKPSSEFTTILDVLQFEDEAIKCVLIDNAKINTTCLIHERKVAETALRKQPRNVSSIITPFDNSSAVRLRTGRGSNLQSDPIPYRRSPSMLGTENPEEALRDELTREEAEYAQFEQQKREINQQERQAREGIDNRIREIKVSVQESTDVLNELTSAIEERSVDRGRLSGLLEDRDDYVSQNIAANETLIALRQEKEHVGAKLVRLQEQYQAQRKLVNETSKRVDEMVRVIEDIRDRQTEHETDQTHYVRSRQDREEKLQTLGRTMSLLNESLKESRAAAEAVCTEEDCGVDISTQTEESIREEVNITKAAIEAVETSLGMSREELVRDVYAKREKYFNAKKVLTEAQEMADKLEHSLVERKQNLKTTRKRLCMEVNEAFQQALAVRGFVGDLEFDFIKGKLSMMVSTKPGERKRMIESLSGGEKSFTQIAFLLALWKPMQSRIRGLDEFDVFMDQINRRLSLKMILEKVAGNPYCQTLFITPLDVGDVPGIDSPTVHIHKIADPERRTN